MPTNGFADGILYTVNEAPIFTYGMITITAAVLAYVTFIEAPDTPIETIPVVSVIPQIGNIPELPPTFSNESYSPFKPDTEGKTEPVFPFQREFESSPVSRELESSPVSRELESSPLPQESSPEIKQQGGKKKKRRKTRRLH